MRNEISGFCKRLAFSQTSVEICANEATVVEEQFLHQVFRRELEHRNSARKRRLLKDASFPVYKTLEGYENRSIRMPSNLKMDDLVRLEFIRKRNNLVMFGPVGTGKTHLAIALGVAACATGMIVRYFTAAELVVRLSEAHRAGTLEKVLKGILKAEVLVIDEWGYVPIDKEGARLLFRVISDSYERRSLIITTNLEFSKWGNIFTDDQMAAAMIDRLAHHGYLLVFEGDSFRMKNALMRQKTL
ncbi:MAG: transposase [Deltaproteobacteria bacterium ADurb.Bin151]|nr:MAG: transposase [Deltaproteobacteria bacterium ADurb.Bin151]